MARRALLIGVSEYGEGFEALPGSLLDVRAMAAVLGNPEQGAFEKPQVLENPARGEMAIAIEQFFQGRGKDDSLLFYFSGHGDVGTGFQRQKLHFCAQGTYKSQGRLMKSSAVSASFLKEQLDDCKAGQVVVILDCCYSGAIADLLRKGDGESAFVELKAEGRVVLASSSASESSWQVADGLSLYTRYLLEGMAGPAQLKGSRADWILARELHDYAAQKLAIEQKGGLSPEIIVARKAGYDVPVVRAPKLDPSLEYRRAVEALFQKLDRQEGLRFDGEIQKPLARMSLETLQQRLERDGLSQDLARQIEQKVQVPYRRRAKQRLTYFRAFEAAVQDGFLPSGDDRELLEDIRRNLLLGEEDATKIERNIAQERQLKARSVPTPVPPQPIRTPEASPQGAARAQSAPQPEVARRPAKGQTATATRSPSKPSSKFQSVAQGRAVPRRTALKLLGFGGVGLGGGGTWRMFVSVMARRLEPTPSILQPFEFEVVTVDETGAIKERKPGSAKSFKEDLGNGIELEMVLIPAGKFTMGSPDSEEGRADDEGPQREVTVPEFLMGRFEVTQAQYAAVMGTNPSHFKGDSRPVEQVSWNEAQEFCQKLSEQTGREYRLPSEAEWEYACRAGTTTPFHFGETISTELANYRGQDWEIGDTTYSGKYGAGQLGSFREETTDVGSFPANAFGLYDMHGNIWEWCLDRWHNNYDNAPSNSSAWATTEDESELYILRGGSWFSLPWLCRSATRDHASPGYRHYSFGFRVACVVSPGLL